MLLLQRAFRALEITNPLAVVGNGEQVLDYLKGTGEFAERARFPIPRLVLLDLEMPRMNGFEVLCWIRQSPQYRHLPVIVLTASAFSADVRTAYLLGANSFLVKPGDFTQYKTSLRQMCDFWLGPCRLPETSRRPSPPPQAAPGMPSHSGE